MNMTPNEVVTKVKRKAHELGLGEVTVQYLGEKAETMGRVFDITQGEGTIQLILPRRDLTFQDREGIVDDKIESALQAFSSQTESEESPKSILETPSDLPDK